MGCDFWWTGTVQDEADQVAAVDMLHAFFDPARKWPSIAPEPDRKLATLFGKSPLSDPVAVPAARGRVTLAYPCNFFGLAPHFDSEADSNIGRRGQIVFDRSDHGRLVSVLFCGGSRPGGPDIRMSGLSLVVIPGGFVRFLPEQGMTCVRFSLFLNLLRLRYCEDLDARDDECYVSKVARAIEEGGFLERAREKALDYGQFTDEFCKYFFPPRQTPSFEDLVAAEREAGPVSRPPETPEEAAEYLISESTRIKQTGLDDLEFSVRTARFLRNMGVETLGQLILLTEEDLRSGGLGPKSVEEVRGILAEWGFTLQAQ